MSPNDRDGGRRLCLLQPDGQRQQPGHRQHPLEDFYAGAKDADVLIYNSTIEGEIRTMDELIAKCPLLAQFKAVQQGNVWCTAQSLFQQSMEMPDLILDMNKVFTEGTPDDDELKFLTKIT